METVEPGDLTIATVPARFEKLGDVGAGIDDRAFSLEPLLELAARDEVQGAGETLLAAPLPEAAGGAEAGAAEQGAEGPQEVRRVDGLAAPSPSALGGFLAQLAWCAAPRPATPVEAIHRDCRTDSDCALGTRCLRDRGVDAGRRLRHLLRVPVLVQ